MPKLDKNASQGLAAIAGFFALLLIFLPKVFFTLHFLELAVTVAILSPLFFKLEKWMNKRNFQLALLLSVGMAGLSLMLTFYDKFFFQEHMAESLIYIAILLLMFFRLEEWAYGLGIMTPIFWILLAFFIGRLGDDRGIQLFDGLLGRVGAEKLLASYMLVGAIALFSASANAYRRVIWGTPKALQRLVISFALVGAFYAIISYTAYQRLNVDAGAAEEQTLEQPAADMEEDSGEAEGETEEATDETADESE